MGGSVEEEATMSSVTPTTALPQEIPTEAPGQVDGPLELIAAQLDEVRTELSRLDNEDMAASMKGPRMSGSCRPCPEKRRPALEEMRREDHRRKLRERERELSDALREQATTAGIRSSYWY
mgnify:CR=1 FL=1